MQCNMTICQIPIPGLFAVVDLDGLSAKKPIGREKLLLPTVL